MGCSGNISSLEPRGVPKEPQKSLFRLFSGSFSLLFTFSCTFDLAMTGESKKTPTVYRGFRLYHTLVDVHWFITSIFGAFIQWGNFICYCTWGVLASPTCAGFRTTQYSYSSTVAYSIFQCTFWSPHKSLLFPSFFWRDIFSGVGFFQWPSRTLVVL